MFTFSDFVGEAGGWVRDDEDGTVAIIVPRGILFDAYRVRQEDGETLNAATFAGRALAEQYLTDPQSVVREGWWK